MEISERAAQLTPSLTLSIDSKAKAMSADEVKFRKPVLPGDTIFIHAEITKSRGERLAKARCHCVVNDAIVSEAELMFTFLDK